MLKTDGDTLESYLGKVEAHIREMHPDWDKQKQWKIEVWDGKEPIPEKEIVNHDKKIIYISRITFNKAFNGDEGLEKETLFGLSLLVMIMESQGK